MRINWRNWLPIALCCVPGIAIAAIVGIGIVVGGAAFGVSFGGPLGLALIAVAVLACPVSMALMMRRSMSQTDASGNSQRMADCCAPSKTPASADVVPAADSLAALRARRKALEREVVELQARLN